MLRRIRGVPARPCLRWVHGSDGVTGAGPAAAHRPRTTVRASAGRKSPHKERCEAQNAFSSRHLTPRLRQSDAETGAAKRCLRQGRRCPTRCAQPTRCAYHRTISFANTEHGCRSAGAGAVGARWTVECRGRGRPRDPRTHAEFGPHAPPRLASGHPPTVAELRPGKVSAVGGQVRAKGDAPRGGPGTGASARLRLCRLPCRHPS